ncbi:hypothetical protein BH09SUM1_BH09SUM1_03770 [soil metagenome]
MDFSALSADTAHRFRAVAELLREHTRSLDTPQPKLLDVGGYPGTFAREFAETYPRWKVTTVDRPKEELPDYQPASGLDLPFADGSFDAVTSIDTLEHIVPAQREKFLSEMSRVSSRLIFVAAPFDHPSIAAIERLLNSAHEKAFLAPHPWLKEHVTNGLPDLADTIRGWPATSMVTNVHSSYDLNAWTTWQALSMLRKLRGELDNTWKAFEAAAASAPIPVVTEIPYRWIVIAKKNAGLGKIQIPAVPPENVGASAVELARVYSRMLELCAADVNQHSVAAAPVMIDQRLKDALAASEQQIRNLEARSSSPSVDTRNAIRRLFNR